ncbi:hypothetical protein FB451DRAFT_1364933 [Mycena latifolia]|nr:hypothetical protein FB451DRAFT_1364933 [Mycena latifolia]
MSAAKTSKATTAPSSTPLRSQRLVVLGGVAEMIAGAIGMRIGGFLASQAERDHYRFTCRAVVLPCCLCEAELPAASTHTVAAHDLESNESLRWSKEVGLTPFLLKFGAGLEGCRRAACTSRGHDWRGVPRWRYHPAAAALLHSARARRAAMALVRVWTQADMCGYSEHATVAATAALGIIKALEVVDESDANMNSARFCYAFLTMTTHWYPPHWYPPRIKPSGELPRPVFLQISLTSGRNIRAVHPTFCVLYGDNFLNPPSHDLLQTSSRSIAGTAKRSFSDLNYDLVSGFWNWSRLWSARDSESFGIIAEKFRDCASSAFGDPREPEWDSWRHKYPSDVRQSVTPNT